MKKFTGMMRIATAGLLVGSMLTACGSTESKPEKAPDASAGAATEEAGADVTEEMTEEATEEATEAAPADDDILAQAEMMATQYDYDGAIALLNENGLSDGKAAELIASCEAAKENLVPWTLDQTTHIFYHSLLVDAEQAFEKSDSAGYKQWMTTVYEFNTITQKLYDEGYVYVDLYDLVEESTDSDGTKHFKDKPIYLPEGKTPMILSLDDLSYYYTYLDHGIASRLIIDEDGKIKNEYIEKDGSVSVGDYDCVPLLDSFLEEHPDGSYHGAKGIIALTGYNGVFGYRSDITYKMKTGDEYSDGQNKWLASHPDFDAQWEFDEACKMADALKADGWKFASHTWGHLRVTGIEMERLKADTMRWEESVVPIIGETNMIIFAHGADIDGVNSYTSNERYQFLKKHGFDYYLNVDSYPLTSKVFDTFVHGGRRNLDGYRLWMDIHGKKNHTSDLFDAKDMIDPIRTDMPDL